MAVKLLKYPTIANPSTDSELERRVRQLTLLAQALASEIETLQRELSSDRGRDRQIDFDNDGIDFYDAVERYEIELIQTALDKCGGNQSQAARLLHLKSTTLNAKMKHYGLDPVRSITLQHP
ncbi:MAG TPA: helix-turn-helix domain-containing protein [Pyrinomonadaceae bacterium]|nr:helix-turn-helix domain-containing protein [Pyrinomonadaceae bacterium]